LARDARQSALDLARQRPQPSSHVFRPAPQLRRAFPARPFVGRSRNSDGLDAEVAPGGIAFA
jgi:hypothetical protein